MFENPRPKPMAGKGSGRGKPVKTEQKTFDTQCDMIGILRVNNLNADI